MIQIKHIQRPSHKAPHTPTLYALRESNGSDYRDFYLPSNNILIREGKNQICEGEFFFREGVCNVM